jgi:hypothetical protein
MPALNTTQVHQRVNGDNVVYLRRVHELHQHCEPQESGPTLIDDIKSIAALVVIVGASGLLWAMAGCPGLHLIGN